MHMTFYGIPLYDWAVLGIFLLAWSGYTWFADYSQWADRGLPRMMEFHRQRWMRQLMEREMRMPDVILMGNFVNSAVFFASTAILITGGLVATLGASDKAREALTQLPFVATPPPGLWEFKVLTLVCVFIYAFVKFIWSVRLANYSSVLFNAAPMAGDESAEAYARELGKIVGLFGLHFNQGLRANFFALAVLGWWVNTWCFLIATALVCAVMYRREYRSKSRAVVREFQALCREFESDKKR